MHFPFSSVTVPEGLAAVASYHAHPTRTHAEGQGLSPDDEAAAYSMARRGIGTLYEADTYFRNVYGFTPWVSRFKPNMSCCGPIGDLIAHIPE